MSLLEIQLTDQIWRSVAIACMILAILTPIILLILAISFRRSIKRMNETHWSNQKIVEKRIEVYDRIAPKLNDIFCFYCYIGNWNEISPVVVLRLKREIDKDMSVYASLFSDDISTKYVDFKQLCFVSMSGWEHDERIKSYYELRQQNNQNWDDGWIQHFDTNNVVEAIKIKERYDELIASFKEDLVTFQTGTPNLEV
jgi:hypothetical protein